MRITHLFILEGSHNYEVSVCQISVWEEIGNLTTKFDLKMDTPFCWFYAAKHLVMRTWDCRLLDWDISSEACTPGDNKDIFEHELSGVYSDGPEFVPSQRGFFVFHTPKQVCSPIFAICHDTATQAVIGSWYVFGDWPVEKMTLRVHTHSGATFVTGIHMGWDMVVVVAWLQADGKSSRRVLAPVPKSATRQPNIHLKWLSNHQVQLVLTYGRQFTSQSTKCDPVVGVLLDNIHDGKWEAIPGHVRSPGWPITDALVGDKCKSMV